MLKVVREELGFGKVAHNERPMASHIPYLRHMSDTVIGLENGALLSVIKLDGLFPKPKIKPNSICARMFRIRSFGRLIEPLFCLVDRNSATGRSRKSAAHSMICSANS